MTKFQIGDTVLYYMFPNIRALSAFDYKVIALYPKKWYHREQRYIIENGEYKRYIVKESRIFKTRGSKQCQ